MHSSHVTGEHSKILAKVSKMRLVYDKSGLQKQAVNMLDKYSSKTLNFCSIQHRQSKQHESDLFIKQEMFYVYWLNEKA